MLPEMNAILVLPRLRIQNLNTISSPMTHGAPAITAVMGFMCALQRHIPQDWGIKLLSAGMVIHDFQTQTNPGYVHTFNLTRNPVGSDGKTKGIVEEGRAHATLTLVFGVDYSGPIDDDTRSERAAHILAQAYNRRFAGGTILEKSIRPRHMNASALPQLALLDEDEDDRFIQFQAVRRQWLPGSCLISRDDLLTKNLATLRTEQPDTTVFDAWLDASRLTYRADAPSTTSTTSKKTKTEWSSQRTSGSGWIVPIPVGYSALSETYAPGEVINARDPTIPFRFVESMYSLGEWISPHRLDDFDDLLWYIKNDEQAGVYRCSNDYLAN